jgi:hypothetical protein
VGVAINEFWRSWPAPGASPCARPSRRFPVAPGPTFLEPRAPARTPLTRPGVKTPPWGASLRVGERSGQPGRLGLGRSQIIAIGSEATLGSQGSVRRSPRTQ